MEALTVTARIVLALVTMAIVLLEFLSGGL